MATIAQTCHAWAHNTGKQRKGAKGHVFYNPDNRALYSYGHHFCIARIVTALDGGDVVLFNRNSDRSMSTGNHCRNAFAAVCHMTVLYVNDPRSDVNWRVVEASKYLARDEAQKASRARKHSTIMHHLTRMHEAIDNANRLNERFGLGLPHLSTSDMGVNVPELEAKANRLADVETERQIAAARKAHAQQSELRRRWLAGEPVRYFGRDPETGGAYLRVMVDRTLLQTSLGVGVPVDHAIKVFRVVKACRDAGREMMPSSMRVGHFQVDHILPNGDFHAGCHFITWSEVERIARELDLLDLPVEPATV